MNIVALPTSTKPDCVATAAQILGSKWTAQILRDLTAGPKRFCEIERLSNGINPRTLSQRLEQLEISGIVVKQIMSDNGPCRGQYELTKKGRDLMPVLNAMAAWGAKYPNC